MKAKTDFPDDGLKTELQWAREGCIVRPEQEVHGEELWESQIHRCKYLYFAPDQVIKADTEEQKEKLQKILEPSRVKAKKAAAAHRENKRKEREHRRQYEKRMEKLRAGRDKCREAPIGEGTAVTKMISIDLETTGLNLGEYDQEGNPCVPDEILQVSIVGANGEVLFSSYVKPYAHDAWPEAEAVNDITPETVAQAPYLHFIAPQVKRILENAPRWVGYNIMAFDYPMLERALGQFKSSPQIFDVMLEFAPIYGEWVEEKQEYKWKSLGTCADYFGVQFLAHDATEDAKATMECFHKIRKIRQQWRTNINLHEQLTR